MSCLLFKSYAGHLIVVWTFLFIFSFIVPRYREEIVFLKQQLAVANRSVASRSVSPATWNGDGIGEDVQEEEEDKTSLIQKALWYLDRAIEKDAQAVEPPW